MVVGYAFSSKFMKENIWNTRIEILTNPVYDNNLTPKHQNRVMRKSSGFTFIDFIVVVIMIYGIAQLLNYLNPPQNNPGRSSAVGAEIKQKLIEDSTFELLVSSIPSDKPFAPRVAFDASVNPQPQPCAMLDRGKKNNVFAHVSSPIFHADADDIELVFTLNKSRDGKQDPTMSLLGLDDLAETDFVETKDKLIQFVREHMKACSLVKMGSIR